MFQRIFKRRIGMAAAMLILAGCGVAPEERAARHVKKGQALLAAKDYARAILEFRNVVRILPRNADAYYQLGLACLDGGDIRMAVESFRKATELNPRHADAQMKLAGLMSRSGNKGLIGEAAQRLNAVVSASPGNHDAVHALALAEAQLGKLEEASKHLEDALSKFPSHLASSVALARLKLAEKKPDAAEAILKKAVETSPKSADAAVALGQFYVLRQKQDLAEAQIRRALDLDNRHATALLTLAAMQMNGSRLGEAEQTYRRISSLEDKRYRALYAAFLFQQNRKGEALAEFERLAKLDPSDRAARTRLIAMYVTMGKTSEAEKVIISVLKSNPRDVEALLQRSELYLRSGRSRDAETDLQEVLRMRPDAAEAHYAMSRVHRRERRVRSERQELNEALKLNPRLSAARITLADSFMLANDPAAALNVLDDAPAAQKNSFDILAQRNWALLALNRLKEAAAVVDQLLRASRTRDVLLQDGFIKLKSGNPQGARAVAEEILETTPGDARAASLLADAYMAQHQPQIALDRVRQLAAKNPDSTPLRMLLGNLLAKTGARTEARKAFESGGAAAAVALAELDLAENKVDSARQRLAAVVATDKGNVSALLLLALAEHKAGSRPGAIAAYRSALSVDASNITALNNLAYLMAHENPEEALKFAQQAVELAPASAAAQDTLGWVYYRKGLYQTAINHLKIAVGSGPTARRRFHLGMCYLKNGQKAEGAELVRAALSEDPTIPKTEQGW